MEILYYIKINYSETTIEEQNKHKTKNTHTKKN